MHSVIIPYKEMVNEKFLTYKCAFGADKKLFQIVSTWGRLERIHLVDDGTIGHNCFQADAVSVHRTLFDELDSSSVSS